MIFNRSLRSLSCALISSLRIIYFDNSSVDRDHFQSVSLPQKDLSSSSLFDETRNSLFRSLNVGDELRGTGWKRSAYNAHPSGREVVEVPADTSLEIINYRARVEASRRRIIRAARRESQPLNVWCAINVSWHSPAVKRAALCSNLQRPRFSPPSSPPPLNWETCLQLSNYLSFDARISFISNIIRWNHSGNILRTNTP